MGARGGCEICARGRAAPLGRCDVVATVLSSAELSGIAACQELLLAPLRFPTPDAWRDAVNERLKPLLGAEKATFVLPLPGIESTYSAELEPSARRAYSEFKKELDRRYDLPSRELALGVWSRRSLWAPYFDSFLRGEYYHDFVIPNRVFDTIGASVEVQDHPENAPCKETTSPQSLLRTAALYAHHDRPTGRRFGRRGLTVLTLLRPALGAGVRMLLSTLRHQGRVSAILDAVNSPVLVIDPSGRIDYRSAAINEIVSGDPEGDRILREAARLAREIAPLATAPNRPGPASSPLVQPERIVRTTRGAHVLRATLLSAGISAAGPAVLVTIERRGPSPIADEELRNCYRLTEREIQVARLVREELSTPQIATQLGIRPHTARHHLEHIFTKLRVHSRAGAARLLRGEGTR